jgi:type I restriction enzyme, S subunit
MKGDPLSSLVNDVKQCNPRDLGRPRITYLDISSVDNVTKRLIAPQRIAVDAAPSRARQLVHTDDVLVSTVRPNLNAVALVPAKFNGEIASTGFCVLRPRPKQLCPEYLFYFTQSAQFIAHLTRIATGASYPAVSDNDILDTNIQLPGMPEQRQIARQLEQADRLRRTRGYTLELTDTFLSAAFLKFFGDPKQNPNSWPPQYLSTVCSKFSDGPFGSNLKSSHYRSSGIRVVRLQNIGEGEFVDDDKAFVSVEHFATLQKHACMPGDVLIGTMGDPNLRACIQPANIPIALNKADCIQARPDPKHLNAHYLQCLLNLPSTLHLVPGMVHGQTRARVSMGELADLPIPVPPLPLQEKFAGMAECVEHLRAVQREAFRQAEHLFASLLHRAFSD